MAVQNILGSPVFRDEDKHQHQNFYRPTYSLPFSHTSKSDSSALPQKPSPALHSQATTILNGEESYYAHHYTTPYRSSSASSQQPYAFSPRTSLSSGSMFSSLDSPSSEKWLNTDFDRDISLPNKVRANPTNHDQVSSEASSRWTTNQYARSQSIVEDEKMQSPAEHRGSKDALSRSDTGSKRNADIERNGQLYRTSFKSEKDVLKKEDTRSSKPMWWILVYLIITNPLICFFNSIMAVIVSIASTFYIPFTSKPTSTFIKSKLSPLLEVHFQSITGQSFDLSLDDVDTMRLVLVHMFSPFVAIGIYVVALCLGVSWLYNILLSDEAAEDFTLKNWILKKWEGYLSQALKSAS